MQLDSGGALTMGQILARMRDSAAVQLQARYPRPPRSRSSGSPPAAAALSLARSPSTTPRRPSTLFR